ncbi:MAG: hypothetical protein EBY44_02270 [Actinobacteria bacterium]|nr:hypothetical protein [Actinomycetota bacterium]
MFPHLAAGAVSEVSTVTNEANWLLENAWLIALLPAISFVLILFFGKKMPFKGAEFGITAVSISFILAILTGAAWMDHRDNFTLDTYGEKAAVLVDDGAGSAVDNVTLAVGTAAEAAEGDGHAYVAVQKTTQWLQSGGVEFNAGIMVDGLSVMMLFVVTMISLLVHIYSTDYVGGDRRYTHFFAFLSLFTASMLFFVLSDNILQMIVGWELVGVCSFALIGHWWEEKPNSDAALKAFITNRVGDVGLLVGMITLFFAAGKGMTFDTITINENILHDWFSFLPDSLESVVVWFFARFVGEGWHLTLGVLFMLIVIFLPGGLVEGGQRIAAWYRNRGKSEDKATKQPAE